MCVDNCNVGGRVITTDGFIIWDDNSNYDFSFWHPNTAQVWPGGGASRCLAIFASYFWKLTDCQFNIGWDETSIYSNYFNPSQTLSIIQYYLYPHIFPSNLRSNQAWVPNLKIDLYIFNKVYYIFVRFTAQLRKIIALIGCLLYFKWNLLGTCFTIRAFQHHQILIEQLSLQRRITLNIAHWAFP